MDETARTKLPTGSRWILAGTTLVGIGGTVVSLAAYPSEHMTGEQWLVATVMGVITCFIWAKPLVLFRGSNSQAVQFDEGFLVILLLLTPPAATFAIFTAAVVVGQIVRRRPLVKSAFNLGMVLTSVSLAVMISRAFAVPQSHISLAAVLGASLGAAAYFFVSSALVSGLLVSMGARWNECISEDLFPQIASSAAGVLVGIFLALDIHVYGWVIALAVPLLFILRMLVTAQFNAQQDRSRMQGLFDVTLDANRRLRQEAIVESVLHAARTQLRCSGAELTTTPPGAGEIAATMDIAGVRHWLTVSGRRREEPFDRADGMLLEALAAIASGALTNAALYRQVRFERSRLASITLNIGEGVCAIDASGDLTFVNPAAADLIRLPARSVTINDSVPGDALRAPGFLLAPAQAVMGSGGLIREEEACFEDRDGNPLQVAYTASAMRQNGEIVGAVIAFRDITERKKLEATMTRQALYDSLTGLANRRMLVERLEAALERSSRNDQVHALIFIDVDRFKAINDSLGHGTGDGLLVAVGSRLLQAAGADALVARFGGDEFVVLVEGIGGHEQAVAVARRICAAVEEPLVLADGYEIVTSLSVGIALTEPGQSADDALRDADVAMYRAKGRGGTYEMFDKQLMGTRSSERIDLEAALRKGIERGELELFYQPLVSVQDQKIVGAEALVRWRHPVEGLIGPERFVPMAEETGLILPLGSLVLSEACREIQAIRHRLGIDLPISVNLSPRQFQQSNLLGVVATALDRAGLPSDLLKFEITETMVMDDLAGATEIMKKLHRLGVRLAIDDFGTGHSSLGYLKNFPVHEVKVDRIFVSNLATDPVDRAIVRAVVDLADAMGIAAVAEGVETNAQLESLRQLGCHRAQGYLFSRPIPTAEFDRLLDRHFPKEPSGRGAQRAALRAV